MDYRSRKTHSRLFLFGTILGVFFALFLFSKHPARAATGINQQINFQGRLLNSAGATVPDGYYNIQFKIYQDGDGQSVGNTTGSPAGSLKWTETYLNANSQGVRVFNGFLTVSLGSVNAFGSSIDWNQSTLWLSMNIGSTNASCTPFTSCTPDGEMVPMQPLTSAVYALNAMQLGGLTASSFGQLSQNQTWTGINTYRPAADATNVFQLQKSSTGVGYITADSTNTQLILGTASSLTGKLAFATAGGGTLTINPTSSASSFTITLPAETGTVCTTAASGACSVAGAGYVQLAPLAVQADGTNNNTIFVNKTSGTGNILELQKSGSDVFTVANNGNVTATGTINGDTVSSTALTFSGSNPVISASTTNTGLSVQANGTGTLALNTTGAGTVNLGATNTTAINIGSSASTNAVLGITNINTTGTAATTIGNSGSTVAIASSAFNLTTAGAVSGVTTLNLSGAISGATATNTINGIVINSQAVSNVTTLGLSGAITGATATNTINGLVINGGALTSVTGITTNGGYTQSGSTANTLTGATTLSGNLIVTGAASVAIQKGTDFSTTGASVAASFTGSLIRLTGASTQTIQGITGATDGRIITLVNAASQAAIIANQFTTGTAASERIITGTGTDISLAPDASLDLRYDTTTSRWRVVSGTGIGANASLSNLSSVAINTSLLPASNNSINLGSNSLAFASGFFGTNVQAPVLNTADVSAGTTASAGLTVRSGNATGSGSGSTSGSVTIKSGDSTNGASGAISIDVGTGSGSVGAITVGSTNATSVAIGNNTANTQTSILGGSNASAIQIIQGNSGTITIGGTGSSAAVTVQCGASAAACNFGANATDHSTIVGSTTGTSATTLRSGSGGITLTGNISASGTYNSNTFDSTTLTFAGANPVISPSTTNTGLTLRANGSGTLTLNTSGAGTINLGTASSTTIGIGNSGSTNTVLGASTLTGTININNTGTAATTIGQGTSTAGTILIQGGVSSTFSVTNSSGSSVLSFAAPSTAGTVTYQLPNGGTGGTTYGICTTFVVCSGYGSSNAATRQLDNLTSVAINTSLLPATNNSISVGSSTLAFASSYYATNVQAPLVNTFDQTAGSTNSVALVLRSGNTAGTTSNTGAVTLKSGDATTGNSGNLTIDSGTASGTKGTLSIGAANTNSLTIGNTTAATTTLIQGGTGGTAVSIQAGASGAINIGTTNINSVSIGSTANTGSLTFGQSTAGETINIANAATAAATTVSILSGAGTAGIATLNLGNNTRVTGISLGNINPAAARTISIGNSTGTANAFVDTINIATNPTTVAGGNTVHIADGTPTGSGTNLVTIGSLANASTTIIQGGTGSNAIQITQATGAGVIIGSANTGSTVTVQCGAGTSSACGFGTNGNDHTTTVGSTVTASQTVIQSGSSGISLNGAVTTSSTINTDTLSATALTFSGANPVISTSTSNTGMTLQSNGTGTLTLNSSGAGTVNVGTANTTTVAVGNTTAATQTTINGGTGSSALSLQVGSGGTLSVGTTVQTAIIGIGNTSASTTTSINGGTGTTALNLQVGNGGSINIGTTVQTSVQNIGNTSASSTTLINGGTSSTAIQVLQGAGGTITIGGTGAASNVLVQCGASATSCNFGTNATDHTTTIGSATTASLTTIQAGSSGISLAQNTTLAANKSLTFTAGTGQYVQTGFSGTNTDAFAVTAASLTTGAGLRVTTTNNSASASAWNANQFNITNAQGTTAASIFGVDYEFTQAATVAGNTESVANFAVAANSGSPADNTVASIINVANNDTATGNQIDVTDGIKINGSRIINGINLSGTFLTNLITSTGFMVANSGSATLGASGGSGALLINNGATLNTASNLGNLASGPIGTAAATVDVYTYFTIPQTTTGQTLTVPSPTSSTAGRIIYITNTGSASFTMLSATISAGTSATLVWSGSAWTYAGADGSSILNQNSSMQTANFLISGTGQANTSLLTPLLDTQVGSTTLNIGTNNATSGISLNQNTTIGAGKSLTVGGSAGSGSVLTNNGATLNSTLALSNFNYTGSGNTGSIGSAASTVDIYTSVSIAQTTASQTLTVPAPTSNTAYGRLLYITNVGTAGFTISNVFINAGQGATIVWSNTNGGASWQFSGAGADSIENQNSLDQTANFRISGTGRANTSFTSPLVDSITGGLSVGTATATSVTIGGTTNTTAITLQGAAAANYIIGNTNTTGTITIGQSNSSNSNIINVGNNIGASGTQTVNIGNSATASSTTNVTVGSTVGASTLTLQAGTGNLKLSPNGASNTGVLLKPVTDSTKLFVIQTSGGTDLLTVDSTNNVIRIGSSTSNSNTIVFALNNNDGTTTPTEVDGGMYFNGATSQFMCGENGFWVSCGVPPRDHSYDQYDEFMNGMGNTGIPTSVCTSPCAILPTNTVGIGGLNWYNSLIGSGQTTQKYLYNQTGGNAPAVDANRPGILDIQQTGTGNNSGQTMSLGVASMKLGTSLIDLKTAVNITGSNLTVLIGLHNETTATTAPTTGAYFKEAGNGTWNVCYVNGSNVETCAAASGSPTATAGTWYRLEIIIVSSTQIDFYINGTKTSLTGITYNTTNNIAPAYTTYKTSGTPGTLDLYIDYFQLLGTTTTGR